MTAFRLQSMAGNDPKRSVRFQHEPTPSPRYHRRRCDLPRIIDARDERDLLIMVTELAQRSGTYEDRIAEILERADAA